MPRTLASQRVFAADEIMMGVLCHLDASHFRLLAVTSRSSYDRFNNDGWRTVDGLGNILAVLDDQLVARGSGPGTPTCQIPRAQHVVQKRKEKFVKLCSVVNELNMYANPKKWVEWQNLEYLCDMVEPAARPLFPNLRSITVSIAGTKHILLYPLMVVFGNRFLQSFCILGDPSAAYIRSNAQDSVRALQTLHNRQSRRETELRELSIFPDEHSDDARGNLREALSVFLPRLEVLTISHWCLDVAMLQALGSSSIKHLAIVGRFAAIVSPLAVDTMMITDQYFAHLETLELKAIDLSDACQLLARHEILQKVKSLRVALFPVNDLVTEPGPLYLTICRSIGQAHLLQKLIMVAGQDERDIPFPLPPTMMNLIANRPLRVLRLYNFCLVDEAGFQKFHAWQDLVHLSIMRQDLRPEDFVMFAQLPNLTHLGANISETLGQPWLGGYPSVFPTRLNLATPFRFHSSSEYNLSNRKTIHRIEHLFLELCPHDVRIEVERIFKRGNTKDVQDLRWANDLLTGLRDLVL
ncbi:hypothetical protein RhiJN_08740 [Ceratobasidium sp. AG-Ba]|nr:hypothetical protein RhiJN_08740 [Ceratobasidium sp. AG-Ba]QRW09523.1 hypothetical protein RhiLY_08522 [Ceratobasidium sp. AG-Ba]QRW09587.1 hypothetical protein RhiLY_08586 [Ceratobasidium sp. AG-Ba]